MVNNSRSGKFSICPIIIRPLIKLLSILWNLRILRVIWISRTFWCFAMLSFKAINLFIFNAAIIENPMMNSSWVVVSEVDSHETLSRFWDQVVGERVAWGLAKIFYWFQSRNVVYSGIAPLMVQTICVARHLPWDEECQWVIVYSQIAGVKVEDIQVLFVSQKLLTLLFGPVIVTFDQLHPSRCIFVRWLPTLDLAVNHVVIVSTGSCQFEPCSKFQGLVVNRKVFPADFRKICRFLIGSLPCNILFAAWPDVEQISVWVVAIRVGAWAIVKILWSKRIVWEWKLDQLQPDVLIFVDSRSFDAISEVRKRSESFAGLDYNEDTRLFQLRYFDWGDNVPTVGLHIFARYFRSNSKTVIFESIYNIIIFLADIKHQAMLRC